MTFLALEGTGATIQFMGSDFTSDLINLVLSERAREHIETTHLGTKVAKTFRPGELVDLGTVRATFDHKPGEVLLVGAPAQQIVIKYPSTASRSFDPLVLYGAVVAQGGQRLWIDNRIVTAVTIRLMVPDVVAASVDPAPGGGWDPSELLPRIWLDASDDTTVVVDDPTYFGSLSWTDKSNGHVFVSGAILGATEAIYTQISGIDVVSCGTMENNGFGKFIAGATLDDYFGSRVFAFVLESSNGGGILAGSSSGAQYPLHRGAPTYGASSSDAILSDIYADSSWLTGTFRLNGSDVDPALNGLSGGFDIIVMKSNGAYIDWQLNALNADRSFRTGGAAYAEVINWDDSVEVTATDITKIEGYLAHKYGLAYKLPSDHPYKSAPP